MAKRGDIAVGTIDSWLVYKLTGGGRHQTDYSTLRARSCSTSPICVGMQNCWISLAFPPSACRKSPIPMAIMGKQISRVFSTIPFRFAAFWGTPMARCLDRAAASGDVEVTYGTGSSIMMNIGAAPVFSDVGVVTSLAWKIGGVVNYVLEGNINYTGAVVSWLKNDLKLIGSAAETEALARAAHPGDATYLVPAFSGLGAPTGTAGPRPASSA